MILCIIFSFSMLFAAASDININTTLSVNDLRGNKMEDGYLFVDNKEQDGGHITNGVANFTIQDFPTGIFDLKKKEQLTIGPNPAGNYARAWTNANGTMTFSELSGRKIAEIETKNKQSVTFTPNGKVTNVTYQRDDGKVEVAKLLTPSSAGPVTVDIIANNGMLKSGQAEYHTFKLGAIPTEAHPFTLVDEELKIEKGSTAYNGTIVVDRAPTIKNQDYTGETFQEPVIMPLDSLFSYDNAQFSIEGTGASIQDGNLIVTDNAEFDLVANDGKHPEARRHLIYDKENNTITVNAKTISIGKVADERNFSLKDQSYINSRLIGSLDVIVTNADGSFYKKIVSDANGNVPAFEVPEKGSYFYLIEAGKTHEAAIKFIVDSLENNEVFAAADTELSVWNALQVHFDYAGGGSVLIPRSDGMNRTKNWKPEYLVPGVMNNFIYETVWDDSADVMTGEKITQEQIDTVLQVQARQDPVLNNLYKNANLHILDLETRKTFPLFGATDTYYYRNGIGGGHFGVVERNNMAVQANIMINLDLYEYEIASMERTINQEILSVKGFGELQKAKKPSVLEAVGLAYNVTDDDKRSLEWYQVRSEMLSNDGVPQKGIWGWDIDQRVFEEANQNQYVQSFINKYGTTETINEFQKYVNGEKSASLKSAKDEYKLTIGIIDLEGQVTKKVVTEDNFKDALQDKDIPGFYKQEIKTLFEK